VIADTLELAETRPGYARVFFEHFRELPTSEQEAVRQKRNRYLESVEDIIRDGIEAGEFRPVDPNIVALAILGQCNWSYQWYRPGGSMQSRDVAYTFWDQAIRGLRARPDDS
jgi:hypothetical protein